MMYRFHVFIHALPAGIDAEAEVGPVDLAASLEITWDAAAAILERLPRLFFEPDGSFVWREETPTAWQVDGQLFERNDRLMVVELKGCCPAEALNALLGACGWPAQPLIFQLVREAKFLSERLFRAHAAGQAEE